MLNSNKPTRSEPKTEMRRERIVIESTFPDVGAPFSNLLNREFRFQVKQKNVTGVLLEVGC